MKIASTDADPEYLTVIGQTQAWHGIQAWLSIFAGVTYCSERSVPDTPQLCILDTNSYGIACGRTAEGQVSLSLTSLLEQFLPHGGVTIKCDCNTLQLIMVLCAANLFQPKPMERLYFQWRLCGGTALCNFGLHTFCLLLTGPHCLLPVRCSTPCLDQNRI